MIEIELSMDAFTAAKEVAVECVNAFRSKGFKVILDKFDGNFVPIDAIDNLKVDALKLTVSGYDTKDSCTIIEEVYDQARIRSYAVDCEGIKSMEQVKALRKGGCRLVQGGFFSPLVNPDEFVKQ
jgi:EAL domain-containing protein (putative c-di-GMP-specific phosphodiesterase class I)